MHGLRKGLGVASLLFLIGAGCTGSAPSTDSSADAGNMTDNSFVGSLADALVLGQSMKCTWSSDAGEGISYIKGDHVRTESTVDGKTSYIVGDGECSYIWEDGTSQGMKFCLSSLPTGLDTMETDTSNTETSEPFGADQQPDVDVNCEKTSVSDDLFTPPSDVTFANPLEDFMNF